MDSITQVILGAAMGEVALGKKIGNRALIWGGIGGTIPDLDVFANTFMEPIDALAFHRSISHSIFFSVVGSFFFAWLVHQLYSRDIHKSRAYKIFITIINAIIVIGLGWGINYIFRSDGKMNWILFAITLILGGYLLWRLYTYYLKKDLETVHATYRDWYLLFFLALATHWMLDCFTAFGTQIFFPFSNYRVAFNNIAIVDPLYSVPFLICVIIVSTLKRNTRKRAIVNWIGIGISSAYMLFTIYNKVKVDRIFDHALQNRNLEVSRCRCTPTIFNNILWTCSADAKDDFYVGQYSLFDSDPNFHWINTIAKNDSIHNALLPLKDYQTLLWFSDNYLAAFPTDSVLILSDVRYGGMQDTIRGPEDLIFNFEVREVNGELKFDDSRGRPPRNMGEQFKKFVQRIKGY